VSLWLGPQIQALLSRERRTGGSCRTRQSRGGCAGSSDGKRSRGADARAEAANSAALEALLYARLRCALAHSPEGRRQLSVQSVAAPSISPGRCPADRSKMV
jgi:hypothetical protein